MSKQNAISQIPVGGVYPCPLIRWLLALSPVCPYKKKTKEDCV